MNMLETFGVMENAHPTTPEDYVMQPAHEPSYVDPTQTSWESEFAGFKTRPAFRDPDLCVSPNLATMWVAPTNIAAVLGDDSRMPALDNKVDPNRIFTSEISALRTLASEQLKVTRMFEKKLMEGLTDRGKYGLDENDVAAMQALTSSRAAIASINKNQVDIKKNIADLKIKQNNATGASNAGPAVDAGMGGRGPSSFDVGQSILANIFDTPVLNAAPPTDYGTSGTPESASALLDELVGTPSQQVEYERMKPKTYVRLGAGDSTEFETYAETGELLSDFPNPSAKIVSVDREAGIATDEYLMTYPIKED